MIDYAMPTMMAEKELKRLHDAALMKDYAQAKECALLALQWAAEAHSALLYMEQQESKREGNN